MNDNLFEGEPDPALGALLRELLDGSDLTGFTARVRSRLPSGAGLWETLAGWARPGIAAALFLAAALGYWMVRQAPAALTPGSVEALAVEPPVDRDAVTSVVLGER
jgi:hypothetical protein